MCPSESDLICYADGTLDGSRRAAVESHLDRCSSCLSLSAELMRSSARGSSHRPFVIDRTPLFAVGTLLGGSRYRILRVVGAGAMGQVYEAEDLLLDRRVALKTLGPLLADDPDAAKRLRSEVAIAHRVTHPNVCRLYDIGFEVLPTGPGASSPLPFITMEFLEGPTLAAHVRARRRLPIPEATSILIQIASGLAAAHEVGVVHRDLKADNVMLVRDGSGRMRSVITDFGLARQVDGSGGDEQMRLSRSYSAPERLLGHPATAASDVYAFGVMACELLAGSGGADGAGHNRDSTGDRSWGEQLPAALRNWIRRAVEPDPGRRFASGQALLIAGQSACGIASGPTLSRRSLVAGAVATAALVVWLVGRPGAPRAFDPPPSRAGQQDARVLAHGAFAPPVADPSPADRPSPTAAGAGRRRGRVRKRLPATEIPNGGSDRARFADGVAALPPEQPPTGDIIRELHISDRRSQADLVGLSTERAPATEAQ
jgi:hypothetical protein